MQHEKYNDNHYCVPQCVVPYEIFKQKLYFRIAWNSAIFICSFQCCADGSVENNFFRLNNDAEMIREAEKLHVIREMKNHVFLFYSIFH